MKTAIVLLIAAVAVQAASAHMCLLQPMQRGGAANAQHMIDDPVCAHTTAPCGGTVAGSPVITVACGGTMTISWIKNVNHWDYANQGSFTVTNWQNGQALGGPFITLADTNTTDLTRYSVEWPIPPNMANGVYTLQMEYITGRGFNFYQCSDIQIAC